MGVTKDSSLWCPFMEKHALIRDLYRLNCFVFSPFVSVFLFLLLLFSTKVIRLLCHDVLLVG